MFVISIFHSFECVGAFLGFLGLLAYSRLSGTGSSLRGIIVTPGKLLYSHSASLQSGVQLAAGMKHMTPLSGDAHHLGFNNIL